MSGFTLFVGGAAPACRRRLVLATVTLAWIVGPVARPHGAACRLPAAEPPAPAATPDPLTAGRLTAEQAAQIVRDQEKKPRFPTAGGEAEIQAALQAVGATADGINQLLLHNNNFFHAKGDLGMYARQFKLNLADMASGELEVRRLLLSQHAAHGATANRFADFLHLGLTEVPPDVADALSEFKGAVCLPRLQRLESKRLAKVLGRQKLVVLRCVTSISDAAAAVLAEGDAHIEVPLLTEFDSEPLARKLAARADLALPGLKTLGPRAAAGLATGQGTIDLPELRTLRGGAAQAIAGSRALFRFQMLNLTPADAAILARGTVRLALPKVGIDSPALLEKVVADSPWVTMEVRTLSGPRGGRRAGSHSGRPELFQALGADVGAAGRKTRPAAKRSRPAAAADIRDRRDRRHPRTVGRTSPPRRDRDARCGGDGGAGRPHRPAVARGAQAARFGGARGTPRGARDLVSEAREHRSRGRRGPRTRGNGLVAVGHPGARRSPARGAFGLWR